MLNAILQSFGRKENMALMCSINIYQFKSFPDHTQNAHSEKKRDPGNDLLPTATHNQKISILLTWSGQYFIVLGPYVLRDPLKWNGLLNLKVTWILYRTI